MRDVVSRLRSAGSDALFEILELDIAIGELTLVAQSLAVAANQLARECRLLVRAPPLGAAARLRSLSDGASRLRDVAQNQANSLLQLKRSLDGWRIVPLDIPQGIVN